MDIGGTSTILVAVANSGEDTVSLYNTAGRGTGETKRIGLRTTIHGIAGPYGVSFCGNRLLVTSPSDNSVSVVQIPDGNILGRVAVGSEPRSVNCLTANSPAVVSNVGDSSVSLIDISSLTVIATIPDVPGSRGWRGVAVIGPREFPGNLQAWIAGTDANVMTVIDITSPRILTRVSIPAPTSIRVNLSSRTARITSATENALYGLAVDSLGTPGRSSFTFQNAQDFDQSGLGTFASIGGSDSVARADRDGVESVISGIPGATAVAAYPNNTAVNLFPSEAMVLVTSRDSNSVFLIQLAPPTPRQFTVSNGASFGTSQAGLGSLASLFGSTGVTQAFNAPSIPLPRQLGGVTLRIGGTLAFESALGWTYSPTGSAEAPLLFVGPSQVNFQVPPTVTLGEAVPAQLTKPDGSTLLTTLNLTATAPGVFTVLQNGQGQAAALNLDNSQNGNPQSILGARPAARGSVIQIFATGGGETDPPLLPGEAAPASGNPLVLTRVQPTVTIGGENARVLFSGMAPGYVGLWQINVQIPAEIPQSVTPGSAVPISITAAGVASNTVTIAIE
jgi:uncharacterized protein (TIGR03437 family)